MADKVVIIGSDRLGSGDDRLGEMLMANFLRLLGENEDAPGLDRATEAAPKATPAAGATEAPPPAAPPWHDTRAMRRRRSPAEALRAKAPGRRSHRPPNCPTTEHNG